MISVCLAAYNGEKYIGEQLKSIMDQLSDNDEIIVSDDGSTDGTLDTISIFNDKRIKVVYNKGNHGPVGNFENALNHANGDYIFLSDQDDIWLPGRVDIAIKLLNYKDVECTICNRIIINSEGKSNNFHVIPEDFTRYPFYKVLYHNPYIGCCMAFSRRHLNFCLPFPNNLPMHDLWIGLLAHKMKTVKYIQEPLIAYRRHGYNVTTGKSPYSIAYRIYFRIRLLYQIVKRIKIQKCLY